MGGAGRPPHSCLRVRPGLPVSAGGPGGAAEEWSAVKMTDRMGGRWLGGGRMGRALVSAACLALCGCAAGRGAAPFPVDVDRRDADGSTPLMKAVLTGNRYFAEVLIAHGADVNARNKNGITPLMVAAYAGRNEIARLLIEKGADVNARVDGENIALAIAGENGNREMVGMLEETGATK